MTTSMPTTSALLFFFLLTLTSRVSLSEESCNPYLKDDGTIDWVGCMLPSHKPAPSFQEAGDILRDKIPDGLVNMANGFVDFIQPNGFPYDQIIEYEANHEDDFENIDYKKVSQEMALWYIGIIICFCIGILCIIIIPFIALFFCCCRCCNNCGGKRIQKETKAMGCKQIVFSIILLSVTVVIGFGMAYSNTGNDFLTTDSWNRTKQTYDLILDEVDAYSDTVTSQLEYIVDEYKVFDIEMRKQIDDRGDQIWELSEPYLYDQCGVDELYDSYEAFTDAINASLITLETMNDLQTEIIDDSGALSTQLGDIQTDLEAVKTTCGTDCDGIDVAVLDPTKANITQLPDLSNEIANVTKVLDEAEKYEKEAKDAIDSVPEEINNSTQGSVNDFYRELDDINTTLEDGVDEVKKVNDDISEFVEDAKIPKSAEDAENGEISIEEMDEYVDYVKYGFIGITCTILLVVMFNIGGMAMGTFTYKQGSPLDRSKCSNAGGNLLMCGVFLSFVFFWILMIIVSVLFLIFSLSYQVCEPLQTKDLFRETIDQPGFLLVGDTGSFLGETIYNNKSYNVSVTNLLEKCEKNESIYQAFQLHYAFDLNDIQEAVDELSKEVDKLIDEVEWDTSDFELVTDDLMDSVNQVIADSSLNEFDFAEYEQILNTNLTNDLETFAENLNTIADSLSNDTIKQNLYRISDEVTLADQQAKALEEKMNELLLEAETLQGQITVIQQTGDDTIKAANYTEYQIKDEATQQAVKNSTQQYADKLIGYTDSYVDHLTTEIEDDLAPCGSVSNLYNLFVDTLCDFNIDAMNTIWFTLGWSIFFFIPSIIFAVKLAKYYRIMEDEYIAVPKPKKKKKNKKHGDVETPEEDEMGADSIQLMESNRRGATNKDVTPYANPHYRHDSPILGYNDLGDRGVPPPAYNYEDPHSHVPPYSRIQESYDSDDDVYFPVANGMPMRRPLRNGRGNGRGGGRRPVSAMYPSHAPPAPRPHPKPKRYSDMYEYNYQAEQYM